MIIVSGNIATGKSTLSRILSNSMNYDVLYEDVSGNEFISDFYEDMSRWAMHSQLYFLYSRARMLKNKNNNTRKVILDRSISEDFFVFSQNLLNRGLMSPREFKLVQECYDNIKDIESDVDLCVYLYDEPEYIMNKVIERDNVYEKGIDINYIESLNRLYEQWMETRPYKNIIKLRTSDIDFRKNDAVDIIINKITENINTINI
ncbi:deoxynucleoside kinase [Hoeflea sp. G2-23]|uniref:Deoxynucleoside kinase n=1 Tax=Hoeflea algicola TaxID=2983763 RepID=A0ABT3ZC08_9HYPH|nr:deoxynucleoside kinase [Hoeflea algicola]MCY0149330.1 deoxynucleoside kinase [Hoeflea algicola]